MITALKQQLFRMATYTAGTCDVRDTIVVAGTGRSGTTWLGQILRELPDYKLLNEPLGVVSNPEAAKAGFQQRTYLHPEVEQPELAAYMEKVLTGRIPHSWKYRFKSQHPLGILREHVGQRKLIVKFTRGLRLLHWLNRQFSVRGIVVIIRHPCAVIASMLKHGGWDQRHLQKRGDTPTEQALGGPIPDELHERFAASLDSVESQTDILAHMWALDYHVALFEQSDQHPWVLVPYERLVRAGTEQLERVAGELELPVTNGMKDHLNVASTSATADLREDALNQLSKWKNALSSKQIDRILDIAETFGLDFYSQEIEPDYDGLLKYQSSSAKKSSLAVSTAN
jgi:hypothetical protein